MTIDSKNRAVAGTGGSGIFRYEPDSSKWIQINNGLTYKVIYSIVKSPNGFLFAATPGAGVFKSEDDGDNWISVNEGLGGVFINVLCVTNKGEIIAATQDMGVFLSNNNGANWTSIGLTRAVILSMIFTPDEYLYVATTDEGIYRTKLDNLDWELVNDGLIINSVQEIICDNKGKIYTAVHKNGVYLYDPYTNVKEDVAEEDNVIFLYPNPAYDWIKIRLNKPSLTNGALSIFNSIGIKQKELDINTQSEVCELKIEDLPSGIYYLRFNQKIYTFLIFR
jgi:ligand-binding sensor domain-containing protein